MEVILFNYAVTAAGALLASLVAVVAWVGLQIKAEIKDMGKKVEIISQTLSTIEKDLRGELGHLDRRIAVIEAKCSFERSQD